MQLACRMLLCLLLVVGQEGPGIPTRILTRKISAGSTESLWTGVNVRGKVFLSVRSRDGKNNVKLWWIKQPFGRVEQLGNKANEVDLDIPIALWKGTISAELKASAQSDTIVYIGENVQVAQNATFTW
jgi:hypothetical protein